MTEQERIQLDRDYPYKMVQSGITGTTRFACGLEAKKHFNQAKTTALLTEYRGGEVKHLAYKFKI